MRTGAGSRAARPRRGAPAGTDRRTPPGTRPLSTAAPAAIEPAAPPHTWRDSYPGLARFLRNRAAVASLFIIVLLFLTAAIGPEVWKHNYFEPVSWDILGTPQPPSADHPAGTDFQARDNFARLLVGARISLAVGIVSCLINLVIGVGLGVLAGWVGGKVDTLLMRTVDIIYSIPLLLIVILLQVFVKPLLERTLPPADSMPLLLSPDLLSIYVALGLSNWLMMARLARGEVLAQKNREYVMAARGLGVSAVGILWRHILPNCLGPLAVAATLAIPEAIFIESFLAFVGLGVSAPAASWGSLADEARSSMRDAPWLLLGPALCISVTMLAFNLFGDGLQDALDPKQRRA
ncbi:MAG: ABC transporter permease [Candidatus Sumerlaeia bacterium]|nr:ABC transporter permease [Candidatus Sumerlaeia bacterium]